jgi:hypothetical protein
MKRIAWILALAGCNQFFELEDTRHVDAAPVFFDATPDAAPVCPDPSEIPKFDRELHQAVYVDADCAWYQTSAVGLALAVCDTRKTTSPIREASVGPITEMSIASGNIGAVGSVYNIALAPEGNEVFIARYDNALGAGIWRYQRDATGAWTKMEKLPVTFSAGQLVSSVTRGPRRHMLVLESNQAIREWAIDEGGVWRDVGTYTATNLYANAVFGMNLSADGRRLVMQATNIQYDIVMMYTHRASIDDRFGPAMTLVDAPGARDAFFTEDCDRMYFSGLGAVFYVRRVE